MPLWFGLLLTLLGWLIQWLLTKHDIDGMNAQQISRMNECLTKMRAADDLAVKLGCWQRSHRDRFHHYDDGA